jgi:hypothetical protein
MDKSEDHSLIPLEGIEGVIYLIRGKKVILDSDLAKIYGVETKRLNEQVSRNILRFPEDFVFQLTKGEFENLKSHFATSSSGWGGKRKLPYAFTEHGALMAASVLNTPLAVQMSVFVVRAFVRMREILASHLELLSRLEELEKRMDSSDEQFAKLYALVKEMITPTTPKKQRRIGF